MSKLLIVHDLEGKLVAVGEKSPRAPKNVTLWVEAMDGQGVFETEREGELMGMKLHEIHKGYRADVAAKRLVKV